MNQATAHDDLQMTITYDGKSIETSTRHLQEINAKIKSEGLPREVMKKIQDFKQQNLLSPDIKQEKQMATINPQTFCKGWFAVRNFINNESDPKQAAIFLSFDGSTMEVAGTDGASMAICQIEVETNIEGTFGLSLLGNAYDEFSKFTEALHSSVRGKDTPQINQLLSLEIHETLATLSIFEPSLFGNEPSLQINLKLLESKDIIQYKKAIEGVRVKEAINTFAINLAILSRVQRAISKLTKRTDVKVMQIGKTNVIVPYTDIQNIKLYFLVRSLNGEINVEDFAFESIQESARFDDAESEA
jgi:hypothetical protein